MIIGDISRTRMHMRRYWMYAAVRAGRQGLLISNDEMRDHIFQVPPSEAFTARGLNRSLTPPHVPAAYLHIR